MGFFESIETSSICNVRFVEFECKDYIIVQRDCEKNTMDIAINLHRIESAMPASYLLLPLLVVVIHF